MSLPALGLYIQVWNKRKYEPPRDKTSKVSCWFCHVSAHINHVNYTFDTIIMSLIRILAQAAVQICAASWQNQESDCAPSEDSDQPGHPPILIRAFAVRMKKAWTLSYQLSAQRRLWSDWADAQADLSLRWAHSHIVGFVMRRLIFCWQCPLMTKCLSMDRGIMQSNIHRILWKVKSQII